MLPFAYKVVKLKIEREFGGNADLRMANQKAVNIFIIAQSTLYIIICMHAMLLLFLSIISRGCGNPVVTDLFTIWHAVLYVAVYV